MSKRVLVSLAALLMVTWACGDAIGIGRGGGGGGARAGGGGAARAGGGGASRAGAARPSVSRPSAPSLGGSHSGGFSRPSASAPSVSRPSVSRPSVSRPASGGSLPSGGLRPSTQPSVSRPSTRPSVERPQFGGGTGGRPTVPDLGGSHPSVSRPGSGGPQIGEFPGAARPGVGSGSRPSVGTRPAVGGGNRPSAGDVSDFLGISPPAGGDRPGIGQRPDLPSRPSTGDRPGLADRPGTGDRPGVGDRPGAGDRPGLADRPNRPELGDRDINFNLNNRPSWVNIDNDRLANIDNRWNQAVTRPGRGDWLENHPDRVDRWKDWGNNVRDHWDNHWNDNWFNGNWWDNHYHGMGCWHYHYWNHHYGWNYWWRVPTYVGIVNWFAWNTPVWSQPIYYDYGTGGNVYYENNNVYINGEEVCTADEFAQSAAALATVDPPANEEVAEDTEWMPLGTFAIATSEQDVDPSRVIQLAVSKEGIISGTYYNTSTDQAQAVLGQVDKETQRVAFRIGDSDQIVFETGIYNLTQDQAPVLVHFGPDKVENYLLVRLEDPEGGDASADGSVDISSQSPTLP